MDSNTNEKITAKSQKVYDFLKNKKIINIPRYQREYSWGKDNIKTFLSDIKEDYYLGNIIVSYEGNSTEIIDGQQRLITTFLILIAIRNLTNDEDLKKKIEEIIYYESDCKLILKDRIGSDGQNILSFILGDDQNITESGKEYSEIKNYFIIKKLCMNYNLNELYLKLISSLVVEIGFKENVASAYEMFVNINTKGKPLAEIEIIKSSLFKYLLSGASSDIYKEKWQEMLKNIPDKEYGTYVSDSYLFYKFGKSESENLKTNGSLRDNFNNFIKEINKESAKNIFDLMTDSSLKNIYVPYSAIKTYNIEKIAEGYYKNFQTSLSSINNLWYLIGEYGFVQSDILFVSLLKDKETFLTHNINFVYAFMQYIFIYEMSRSISILSPAHYSNRFKQIARELYNKKDSNEIKEVLKFFVEELQIDYDKLKNSLTEPNRFLKNYKTAKFIILMVENNFNKKLTVEHFIPKKTNETGDKEYIGYLGNLIPVTKDKYKDRGIEEKLEMYKKDSRDLSISNFLKYEFDKDNYKDKIKERTNKIADEFVKIAKECYDMITR